jgi:serine/threonine-protein kinase
VHDEELTGRVLDGKYVLGPVIGRGAIGRVYRAKQISLEREVAIKILNPGYSHHPEAIARFRLEARAASRIRHPGIVTILDWGKDVDGLVYLVIEYLPGRDLFDVAQKEAPLESARIARLMQQVALALGHAHGEGVIHRDLKPENLRVVEDPVAPLAHRERIKIYDFGVAHVTRGLTRVLTQVGVLVGTPYYMSPEQAASIEVLPQSDLYSCGVIMFLLATGTLPFVAPSPIDVAAMHLKKRPLRPSVLNTDLDPRLEKVILRCLSKDPWQRPASGAELAAMLEPIASHPQARFPTQGSGTEKRAHKPTGLVTAWAVGATTALVALGAFHVARGGLRASPAAAASPICPTMPTELTPFEHAPLENAPSAPNPLAPSGTTSPAGAVEPSREVEVPSPGEGPTDIGPPSEVQRDKSLAPVESTHSALGPSSAHPNEKL